MTTRHTPKRAAAHLCYVQFLKGDAAAGSEYAYRVPRELYDIAVGTWVLVSGHGAATAVPRIARVVRTAREPLDPAWRTRWLLGAGCDARLARETRHP